MKDLKAMLKPIAPIAGLLLLVVADVALAQQGSRLSQHLDGHASEEVSGLFRFFILMMSFIGVVMIAVGGIMAYCLINEKGPQTIQQIGWKGPAGAFIIGGLLFSLNWVVGTSAATTTGTQDNQGWQNLQGSIQRIEPLYAQVEQNLFVVENELT